MCFSATASFITSAALSATGVATSRKSTKKKRLIAIVPLLFGFQQFLEGVQWLFIANGEVSMFFGYSFLFFAFLLWPTYIPLAIYYAEENETNKNYLKVMLTLGILTTIAAFSFLLANPLTIQAIDHHIVYGVGGGVDTLGVYAYIAVVIVSMFVSSDKLIKIFGALVLASAIIAWFFFHTAFYSTWCIFAAILSVLIYFYIRKK